MAYASSFFRAAPIMSEVVRVIIGSSEVGVGTETRGARLIAFCAKSCDECTGASVSPSRADEAAAAAAAGLLASQCLSSSPSLVEAAADCPTGQSIAANHAAGLATSDGTAYTLEYLDRSRRFSVWHGNGRRSSFSELLSAAHAADVVMLGEDHHDAVTHKLQEILFARLAASRPVSLSLEMFETDVQHVLDEYLGGLLREQELMSDLT